MSEEEQIILPDGFKKVQYLESTGNEYINTGLIPNETYGFYADVQSVSGGTGYVAGTQSGSGQPGHWLRVYNNIIACSFNTNYYNSCATSAEAYNRIVVENNFLNNKKLIANGTKTVTTYPSTFTHSWKYYFTIFKATYTSNSNFDPCVPIRIFRWKMSIGENIVQDLVPAYDTSKRLFCMYDIINNKAYYNAGSGDFVSDYVPKPKENEVIGVIGKLPEGFTRLPNLIGNGKQWIDTSYVPTNETGYYIKAQTSQTDTTWRPIFGLFQRDIENSPRIYLYTNPYPCLGWNTTATALTSSATFSKDKMVAEFNFLNSRKLIIDVNENELSYDLPTLEFTPTNSLYLFSANGQEASMCGCISTFIISEGSEIVREFVPCLDTEGVACIYELHTGTVHYNQGAGQFSTLKYNILPTYNLPANYKKCLYLQSDGTQWIDTGVIPNNETGLFCKTIKLDNSNSSMFGVRDNSNTAIMTPYIGGKTASFRWAAEGKDNIYTLDKAGDYIFSSYINFYNDRFARIDSEDTDWFIELSSELEEYTQTIWLFSTNYQGSFNNDGGKYRGRIYRAQITQGDTLIRDFVPALDNNNKPCMYDLINDECYYNQGTGEDFAYCIEHQLPSDFIKLKYLESDNNQHIKTGYVPTNNTGMYVDGYNTVVADTTVMGMQNTTSGNDRVWIGGVMKATYGARYGWGSITTPNGTGDVRFEQTLNWLNDKKSIITCPAFAQKINTLSNLSFTPDKDIYFFGWNRAGSLGHWKGRIYRAKISEGAEIVRDFVPAYDMRRFKPCMYDLINNVAYYNDGSDEFLSNRDFEGTYTGFGMLGGIGNKLGSLNFYDEVEIS